MEENLKQLLLTDLCGRLPYGVICDRLWQHKKLLAVHPYKKFPLEFDNGEYIPSNYELEDIKPYLRPMSSMTEEEEKEYYSTMDKETQRNYPNSCDFSESVYYSWTIETFDWLNAHHFDVRNLIKRGLALEAPEGMY